MTRLLLAMALAIFSMGSARADDLLVFGDFGADNRTYVLRALPHGGQLDQDARPYYTDWEIISYEDSCGEETSRSPQLQDGNFSSPRLCYNVKVEAKGTFASVDSLQGEANNMQFGPLPPLKPLAAGEEWENMHYELFTCHKGFMPLKSIFQRYAEAGYPVAIRLYADRPSFLGENLDLIAMVPPKGKDHWRVGWLQVREVNNVWVGCLSDISPLNKSY
jgi:hypothetical protein